MTDFEQILPRLMSAYEHVRLVPFIGSGLSIPACRGWKDFIGELEKSADLPAETQSDSPSDLIRRANRAVRTLRNRDMKVFPEKLRRALVAPEATMPGQTEALAKLYWPLVLTTNYDNCFETAFREVHRSGDEALEVLGRRPADCHRVLSSLTSPSGPVLWALQGYLSAPFRSRCGQSLEREVVVGHDEYSKVTHREVHFRRVFAEVFLQRSLLFLGSGLADPYLQGLFGEITELYGTGVHRHCALVREGEIDTEFVRSRFNVLVVEYRSHEELPEMLEDFARRSAHRVIQTKWAFSLSTERQKAVAPTVDDDLEIVRAPLPTELAEGECVAISAGGSPKRFVISKVIRKTFLHQPGVRRLIGKRPPNGNVPDHCRGVVRRYGDSPVFAVRARGSHEEIRATKRDLRVVAHATQLVLDAAEAAGFQRIRFQLLAVGQGRAFPERASFMQMVRAFADWRRRTGSRLRATLHVITPGVYLDILAGRIDLVQLLAGIGIRFWADVIHQDETVERYLFHRPVDTRLGQLLDELNLPRSGWDVEVVPAPVRNASAERIERVLDQRLDDLGVVPDSTVSFSSRRRRATAPVARPTIDSPAGGAAPPAVGLAATQPASRLPDQPGTPPVEP